MTVSTPPTPATNPLSTFGQGYLDAYPDVKAAGFDPIQHYMTYGQRETRQFPGFSADDYLKVYPDVKAAGMDPFMHYTRHGYKEGRSPLGKAAATSPASKDAFGPRPDPHRFPVQARQWESKVKSKYPKAPTGKLPAMDGSAHIPGYSQTPITRRSLNDSILDAIGPVAGGAVQMRGPNPVMTDPFRHMASEADFNVYKKGGTGKPDGSIPATPASSAGAAPAGQQVPAQQPAGQQVPAQQPAGQQGQFRDILGALMEWGAGGYKPDGLMRPGEEFYLIGGGKEGVPGSEQVLKASEILRKGR